MLSTDSRQFLNEIQSELEAVTPPPQAAPLSGKQRRALLKRDRRKRKRQALAKLRLSVDQPEIDQDHDDDDGGDDGDDKEDEEERQRLHQEWLERERIAQEEFRLKQEKEEVARRRKEEEEKRIREEWEEQQRKEREEREQKQQEKRDREIHTKEKVTSLQLSSSTEEKIYVLAHCRFSSAILYVCTTCRKLYRKCWTKQKASWKMEVPGKTLMHQWIMAQKRTGQTVPSSLKLELADLGTGALESMIIQFQAVL
ncbi:hypothetical protein AOLI_G00151220 [Acnodon oligacanthus]